MSYIDPYMAIRMCHEWSRGPAILLERALAAYLSTEQESFDSPMSSQAPEAEWAAPEVGCFLVVLVAVAPMKRL